MTDITNLYAMLDDIELVERARETFDHTLVQELAKRLEDRNDLVALAEQRNPDIFKPQEQPHHVA